MATEVLQRVDKFGLMNTFNPYKNSLSLRNVSNQRFKIDNKATYADTNVICVTTGLIPNYEAFLGGGLTFNILDPNTQAVEAILQPKIVDLGSGIVPMVNEINWFDVVGMQGDFYVNSQWAGYILEVGGNIETCSITAEDINGINNNISWLSKRIITNSNQTQTLTGNDTFNISKTGLYTFYIQEGQMSYVKSSFGGANFVGFYQCAITLNNNPSSFIISNISAFSNYGINMHDDTINVQYTIESFSLYRQSIIFGGGTPSINIPSTRVINIPRATTVRGGNDVSYLTGGYSDFFKSHYTALLKKGDVVQISTTYSGWNNIANLGTLVINKWEVDV